jgi:hypothetical protein
MCHAISNTREYGDALELRHGLSFRRIKYKLSSVNFCNASFVLVVNDGGGLLWMIIF